MEKTSMGLEENVAGALTYIVGWLTGIIFLLIEKDNKFVRFHAMQSTLVFLSLMVLDLIFAWIPFFGWIISILIGLLILMLWLLLMYKAYKGEKYKLPIVGDIAEKHI